MGRTHTRLTNNNSEYKHTLNSDCCVAETDTHSFSVCVQGRGGVSAAGAPGSVGAVLPEVSGAEASAAAPRTHGATDEPEGPTDGAAEERQPGDRSDSPQFGHINTCRA